jgi:hypothetical protein
MVTLYKTFAAVLLVGVVLAFPIYAASSVPEPGRLVGLLVAGLVLIGGAYMIRRRTRG